MPIPAFQDVMLPLLTLAADELEHSLSDAVDSLADGFQLTEEERRIPLPSGRQYRFENRVNWSRTYLTKAELLRATGRGKFQITERGIKILRENPSRIDIKFLSKFPEFVEFKNSTKQENGKQVEREEEEPSQTPEEKLEISYQSIRTSLAQDLLDKIKTCSPSFFEKLVVDLLISMGYGGSRKDAGQAIGRSGDGGIDGIIKEDKLGLDAVYIQAKRWEGGVGRPIVQGFAGSLEGHRARKGVLITTSFFSAEAKDYVTRIEKKIVLLDGPQLAQLMIDHGVGITEVATYTVKRIDSDYFSEG